jgi:hypothetical protein
VAHTEFVDRVGVGGGEIGYHQISSEQLPRRRSTHPRPREPGPLDEAKGPASGRGEEVALTSSLYALQQCGQEAAGIAVSDGTGVVV